MGTGSSTLELTDQIVVLLEQQGIEVKEKTVKKFIKTLEKTSPWLVHSGGLNIPDGNRLREICKERCGNMAPRAFLSQRSPCGDWSRMPS